MNSEDGQVYSVCILQFYCFTKYNRMQSKHQQTKCEHSRRNFYRFQLSQQVSLYKIKELFEKTISNSSLNSHVFGTPCILYWYIGLPCICIIIIKKLGMTRPLFTVYIQYINFHILLKDGDNKLSIQIIGIRF